MDTATSERPPGGPVASAQRETYWPEIDGLRTIAVVSVLAFHLDRRLLGGGFIGVDIFFVISGYLITGLLIRGFEQGDSILRFYQRRIARIAPAAFLVVALTMMAADFVYSAQDFASVGAAGLAATLSFINIKLLFQGTYFQISPDAQPLIHYWSLAVEEQFYLVFPILLYFLMPAKRYLLICVLCLCAISYVACIVATPIAPIGAFYLLPTRAWELLAGASLAIAQQRHGIRLRWGVPIGLAALVISFVVVADAGFPGWIAILPVAGSTAVLAGIQSRRGAAQRFLAQPLMVFVGQRSYSLYLWHWPAFSLVDYHFYSSDAVLRLCLKALITVGGTLLSFHFVERPMRQWLNIRRHRLAAFGGFAIAALLLGVVGYDIRSTHYLTAEPNNIAAGGIAVNPAGRGWVVLLGDSQGAMYGYELASLARKLNFRLNIVSVAAGDELPGEPETQWPNVLRFLDDHKPDAPDAIILAEVWSSKLGDDDQGDVERGALESALSTLTSRTRRLLVLSQPPIAPPDATRERMRAGARPPFFESRQDAEDRLRANSIIRKLANEPIQVLDAAPYFLEADHSIKAIAGNGRLTYHDPHHLSDTGAALVLPAIELFIKQALNLPPSGAGD